MCPHRVLKIPKEGNAMSDQGKRALLGGAAIAIAMLLWVYLSFLN